METNNGIPIFKEKTFTYQELLEISDCGTKEYSRLDNILTSIAHYGAELSMEQIVSLMEYRNQSIMYYWKMEQELKENTGIIGNFSTDYFGFLNKVFDYLEKSDKPNDYLHILCEIAWSVASEITIIKTILEQIQEHKQSNVEQTQSSTGLGELFG